MEWPDTRPSEDRGQGQPRTAAVGQTLTIMEEACRAQSPFPWAQLILLSGTVHCQQLPNKRSDLNDGP